MSGNIEMLSPARVSPRVVVQETRELYREETYKPLSKSEAARIQLVLENCGVENAHERIIAGARRRILDLILPRM